MSSKADSLAVRRPSIDDLVAIARAAGRDRTTRRTIRYWVERGLVDGPVRSGRDPRYPLRTLGQVDTLARLPVRTHGIEMVRFALFIETDSVPVADALNIAATRIDALRAGVSASREQAARDPELLRAEVKRTARLRVRNSVLPREVRMSHRQGRPGCHSRGHGQGAAVQVAFHAVRWHPHLRSCPALSDSASGRGVHGTQDRRQ
jgi:hypothetical protein